MATRKTSTGATVTTTSAKPSKAPKAITVASPLPTVQTPVPAPAPAPVPAVALRGGPAVASVITTGKIYRTKAQHNLDWWAAITKRAGGVDATPVATLLEDKVPSHFIGYCIRRGYLQAA